MKKLFVGFLLGLMLWAYSANGEELPDWVYQSSQKQVDVWLFSGSVHGISLMNVAVPLARSAALSNLVSAIGVSVNSAVAQKVDGSEIDGYSESIMVSHGYVMDGIKAYGVRQRELHVERYTDDATGRMKFNVHVLLEVSDADLKKAQVDFAKRSVMPKPVMKPTEPENAGLIRSFIRKVGL